MTVTHMSEYYSSLRRDYSRDRDAALDERALDPDPARQFRLWLDEAIAAGLELPNAMALATVTEQGRPAARYVLLKEVDADGFVFFTHTSSDKGRQLARNAFAALAFYWPPLHRQARIEGAVAPVTAAEADAYFATRPYGSRLAAHAAPQSAAIPGRAWLEARMRESRQRYPDESRVPRPDTWGGYRVRPDKIEFWQGREDRLHDRVVYTRRRRDWRRQRLAP